MEAGEKLSIQGRVIMTILHQLKKFYLLPIARDEADDTQNGGEHSHICVTTQSHSVKW